MDRIPDVSQRVPVPSADVRIERSGAKATLRRRRFGPVRATVAGWFRIPPDFTVGLDELGTAAWDLLDGRRTVGEVRALLEQRFPGQPDIAARMGRFVGALVSHRMLRLE